MMQRARLGRSGAGHRPPVRRLVAAGTVGLATVIALSSCADGPARASAARPPAGRTTSVAQRESAIGGSSSPASTALDVIIRPSAPTRAVEPVPIAQLGARPSSPRPGGGPTSLEPTAPAPALTTRAPASAAARAATIPVTTISAATTGRAR
jgi:hypothetical protein